jgi:hypothetical protein
VAEDIEPGGLIGEYGGQLAVAVEDAAEIDGLVVVEHGSDGALRAVAERVARSLALRQAHCAFAGDLYSDVVTHEPKTMRA